MKKKRSWLGWAAVPRPEAEIRPAVHETRKQAEWNVRSYNEACRIQGAKGMLVVRHVRITEI